MRDLRAAITQIDALATRNPAQRESLRRLAQAATEKAEELQETIRLTEAGDRAAALGLVLTDIGREQTVAIDQFSDRIAADEQARLLPPACCAIEACQWSRLGIAVLVALC